MISTTVCRVTRPGVVLRGLHPGSSKLFTPLSVITRVAGLRSTSANSPAIRYFSASTCVFVAKKATKTAAAKPKKTAASATTKKKPVKKVAKKTTKKVATKKKTTARRKIAKKKATPKKKALTPEQKEKQKLRLKERKEKEQRAQKREEKKQLLETGLVGKEPKNLPTSGWMVLLAEKFKAEPNAALSQNMSKWAAEYKALSPAELERYKAVASQNGETNKATYDAWVKSLPAKTTYQANEARRRLTRYFNKKVRLINDARIPKRPSGPFMGYIRARPPGDSGTLVETTIACGKEWKSMTDAQKQPYVDMWNKDKQRYKSEMKAIGIDVNA